MQLIYFFMSCFILADCRNSIINITENPGVLPINLGPARLQRSTHTFLHYYDLEPIYQEIEELDSHHNILNELIRNKTFGEFLNPEDLDNYNKATLHIRKLLQDKLDGITPGKLDKPNKRNRRSFLRNIGSTIKLITGNLDEDDGERINDMLKQLSINQDLILDQIKGQYSVSHKIIEDFNNTVQNILHNERTLKTHLELITNTTQHVLDVSFLAYDKAHLLAIKDTYNQLIIIYNSLLSLLQDVENSLTFCKIKTLHPSIITPGELFTELQKISHHYNQELPLELNYKNIFQFEKLIEVDCHIEDTKIVYLLHLPINFQIEFELYYLLPLPTFIESNYFTVIPTSRYILKSNNIIKPLTGRCNPNKPHQCSSHLLSNSNVKCETQILNKEQTSDCQLIKLEIGENKLELLADINQFLAVFSSKDTLTFRCEENTEIENLVKYFIRKMSL
ncbi:hypothetical protein WDU94_015554 [Cyamophila willieti]